VGKKCAKEGAKMILIPPTFWKIWSAKNLENSPARQCSFWYPPPPPPPL
jgi:hypothetical protein